MPCNIHAALWGFKGKRHIETLHHDYTKEAIPQCRLKLQRGGSGPVAAADDGLELQSRVQLLDGPFFEGQYMIGSVNFVRTSPSEADGGSPLQHHA